MTTNELADAREFADTSARIDQSGVVFRHLCLLLGHAEAHGFTRDEALWIIDIFEDQATAIPEHIRASVKQKLRESWL